MGLNQNLITRDLHGLQLNPIVLCYQRSGVKDRDVDPADIRRIQRIVRLIVQEFGEVAPISIVEPNRMPIDIDNVIAGVNPHPCWDSIHVAF